MSYVDDLVAAYARFVALPWQASLAGPQRVWMAIYPPENERRVRLHIQAFQTATIEAGHQWASIDVTTAFESWMAQHRYRDSYFKNPRMLSGALPSFLDDLARDVREDLSAKGTPDGVVALLGVGALFGLGDAVKVSALLDRVSDAIAGRLLVLFPGQHEGNSYRLLDARDGWNYLATPILPTGGAK
ncbi:DUF1788 domain-containing protein [Miltoncostaea oceani]|uniref:DUF1788 domain-containing protein n=1 Tax=Miltoncostaea oceani TaxID=2843216 RepID=UPI001C3CB43D|nr:DUF1788 domain-containing protein [Miltoncostaea oceani]